MNPTSLETFELPVSLRIRGSLEDVFAAWLSPTPWLCDRPETEVLIEFRSLGAETGVKVLERSWPLTKDAVAIALDQACGWENVLCRLKAWIDARVTLR